MAEAEAKGDTNRLPPLSNGHAGDLLQGLVLGNHFLKNFGETLDDDAEDLSLGLSLNGQFGVDPKRAKKLTRSSSISDFMLTNDEKRITKNNGTTRVAPPVAYAPLIRTCSLPTETEEEWRKRKEVQSLRRMEAKRKRLEKMKNARTGKDQPCVEANYQENVNVQSINGVSGGGSAKGSESKGSIGSQGSGSSGISESESLPTQGTNRSTEAKSPSSPRSMPKQNQSKPTADKSLAAALKNSPWKLSNNDSKAEEIMRNMMMDMPCVSTRGVGPNGKRVEGFLYRYRKGEEVRIVCVCHGSFLSPAEFVKHAGGGDVAHPLKHIVVSPSSLL